MKGKLFLFLCMIITGHFSCSDPPGCVDSRAVNFDPAITVANASCIYPELFLQVVLTVDTLPLEINRIYDINGYKTAFKQFQCYLSQIELTRPDQTVLSASSLYPLLKENQTFFPLGDVYVETFDKISFNIGVDPSANANIFSFLNDPLHPLTLQSPDTMHWNNNDGYIFLKMVGKVDRNGDNIPNEHESFDLQIGTDQLLRSVDLAINKSVELELDTIKLRLDVNKLLLNVDLQTEQSTMTIDNLPLATKIADNIAAAVAVN
jgi:hypothetical protein